MRLSTRTAIAAALAAAVSLTLLGVLFRGRIGTTLRERVDHQLVARAATAPILAAVGDRLAVSELGATVEGARVVLHDGTVRMGALPAEALPAVARPGWATARADGQNWRLYTVEVLDVPALGDRTLVQLVAPLGDVDLIARQQRRSLFALASVAVAACGLIGYGFGALASRPLTRLRRDANSLGDPSSTPWRMGGDYGAAEVDDIAEALNHGLDQVAVATARREAALESARAFAASAAHELRTPLTGAITDLDVAAHTPPDAPQHGEAIVDARAQLRRMTATLIALRQLADAELADPTWFTEFDLADQVAAVVEHEVHRHPEADIRTVLGSEPAERHVTAWLDGLRLAVGNLVRNAIAHGAPAVGRAQIAVTVEQGPDIAVVRVDDNGRGIADADRERLVRRFERGETSSGSGLGLALVARVAELHHGRLTLGTSPLGGLRAELTLTRPPAGDAWLSDG